MPGFRCAWALALLLPITLLAQDAGSLSVTVVSGDSAINNLHHFAPQPTVVEVRNELAEPVPGATISFTFPSSGPSGAFADGSRTGTATTDVNGRATLARFTPNRLDGSYQILVNAASGPRKGTAYIRETNVFSVTNASPRRVGNGAKILIVVAVGAAIAAASLLAIKSGSSSTSSSAASATSISLGAITVGAPH